jgi:hypothetical protein
MIDLARSILSFILLFSALANGGSAWAQTPAAKNSPTKSEAKADEAEASKLSETALLEAQRRDFVISLVISLADEARSYRDLGLRSRVLARSADALWDADNNAARALFRRAWEAAEKGDAEEVTIKTKDAPPPMVIAMRRMSGRDLRSEVITLAGRRDHALGEELLAKLTEQTKSEAADGNANTQNINDGWSTSPAAAKRLLVARNLLDEGQVERALEFAAPVLNQVNEKTISFLSVLRVKRPDLADQTFALLLNRVEFDPAADANTISGLSSYAFTPGFYVTFWADGGVRWTPQENIAPPNLPAALVNRFFQVAGNVLLRPLPPADQDTSSAGRIGKSKVIKRLLPLFDQYAPSTAAALRSQLTALSGEQLRSSVNEGNSLLTQGIQPEASVANTLEKMQNRLDHAKTTKERDAIYADAAAVLASRDDARAQDLAEKIDNSEQRAAVRGYVDLSLVRFAIKKKDASSVVKLAKAGVLTHPQRTWAYTQAAQLLIASDRSRALDLLEEAIAEARRIEAADPNRARVLIAVVAQLLAADQVRAWEIMGEAVKAANGTVEFSGEDIGLLLMFPTESGLKLIDIAGSEFSLASLFRALAKVDLTRANDLAKGFTNDAPRAVATLALAKAVLVKPDK